MGDCSWPTTTSEPWMGAKPASDEQGLLPKPKPKDAQLKPKPKNAADKQEALLFGGETVVAEAMSTQVSLSTLLLLAMAAFAMYQLYQRCPPARTDWSTRRLSRPPRTTTPSSLAELCKKVRKENTPNALLFLGVPMLRPPLLEFVCLPFV